MKNKFVWDNGKFNCVNISFIRNFSIEPVGIEKSDKQSSGYAVIAWFGDTSTLRLIELPAIEEAREYVDNIKKLGG